MLKKEYIIYRKNPPCEARNAKALSPMSPMRLPVEEIRNKYSIPVMVSREERLILSSEQVNGIIVLAWAIILRSLAESYHESTTFYPARGS